MRFTLRWKLFGSHLLVLLAAGGILAFFLHRGFDEYARSAAEENLFNEAKLAALMIQNEARELQADAPRLAEAIGGKIEARVTILSATGEVWGDSQTPASKLKDLENHLGRPEVQEANKKGAGRAVRYSATLGFDMLYVAIPLGTAAKPTGYLRLALLLSDLEKAKGRLQGILIAALGIAALLALILSLAFSHLASGTIRAMSAIARLIGQGDFSRRLPQGGQDETADLARVMNDMANKLEIQIATLEAEKKRLDAILAGMGEGLLVTDRQGLITLVNPALRNLFSVIPDVTGRTLLDITRHPLLNQTLQEVLVEKTEKIQEIQLPDPREKVLLTHWVPLLDQGELRGVVAVFHDISQLKKLETIRRDFVANVSHELRTPLTIIQGYAETLLSGLPETDQDNARKFVDIIYRHTKRLADMVRDLLSLSELESPTVSLNLTSVDLESVGYSAWTLLQSKAQAKEITLEVHHLDQVPPVLADHQKIEQVFFNLLDNAIKHTPVQGRIFISAETLDRLVQVSITDTGPGIPFPAIPRIFERFYRVDQARGREDGETGLGLAIVKHIVQLHGGQITAENVPGGGARFTFSLPKAD